MGCWRLVALLLILLTLSSGQRIRNALNGRHIVVLAGTMSGLGARNSTTGEFLDLGVTCLTINSMKRMMNFTYTGFYYGSLPIDPIRGNKSLIGRLIDGEGELAIGSFVPTVARNRAIDLSSVFQPDSIRFLIPIPELLDNRYAIFKPYTLQVWISLSVACVAVICAFYLAGWIILRSSSRLLEVKSLETNDERNSKKPGTLTDTVERTEGTGATMPNPSLYVLTVMLSQGASCLSNRLSIRLIAASFCLGASVLVCGYSSLLITYIMAPNNPPLIRSVYDLLRNDDIKLMVDKGRGLDLAVSQSTETSGIFPQLRDRLNKYPDSRCDVRDKCVKTVLDNRNNDAPVKAVYGSPDTWLSNVTRNDFKLTGKCRVQITADSFLPLSATWMLPKNSPYTNDVNIGLMKLTEAGLVRLWTNNFHSAPVQCDKRSSSVPKHNPRLSMKNLVGSFILLAIGFAVSCLVFHVELIVALVAKRWARKRDIIRRSAHDHFLPDDRSRSPASCY